MDRIESTNIFANGVSGFNPIGLFLLKFYKADYSLSDFREFNGSKANIAATYQTIQAFTLSNKPDLLGESLFESVLT